MPGEASFDVAVIAEQPVARAGLEKVASDDARLHVRAAVASAADLFARPVPYDIVVIDLPHFGDPELKLIGQLAATSRILVSSSWDGPPTLLAAIRAGAHGCVSRLAEQETIREGLRVVAQGGFFLCPRMLGRFQLELARADDPRGGLAPREVETLRWIASGFTHAQIASRMGLSQATINTYAKRIRAKLKVNTTAELTRVAIELGHLNRQRTGSPV